MRPSRACMLAGVIGGAAAFCFAFLAPLPVPFPGATLVAAAALAFLGTLALAAWMPTGWLWYDAERLAQAFAARHDLGEEATKAALAAIVEAHDRAAMLRQAAPDFQEDLRANVTRAADRLDAVARDVFYTPKGLSRVRSLLTRSALIEEATLAHADLRKRTSEDDPTAAASRESLWSATQALEEAFAALDLSAERKLLDQVETASSVAETLLAPRARLR